MNPDTLLIRADASVAMGTGHVMRCLALAQAWQDASGRAVFAMAESTPAVEARLAGEGIEVVAVERPPASQDDVRRVAELARETGAEWVVVDGYRFDDNTQRSLKDAGLKVLFIDDYGHAGSYVADLVLNQNISANEALYHDRRPDTRLILGPRFALLRREFASWRHWKREVPAQCRRLLVMMGGSDPENITGRVLESLVIAKLCDVETTIVVGGSSPHFPALKTAADTSRPKTTVRRDVSNVAELMAGADIAICGAGSTCWELCLLSLPALLIDVADNQTPLARELDRTGAAIHVGNRNLVPEELAKRLKQLLASQELRQAVSHRCRELVDGNGARRLVSLIRGSSCVWLRGVTVGDQRLLWEWANDPDVRAASFSTDAIAWETHVSWFDKKFEAVKMGTGFMFVAEDQDELPIGQIRFDQRPDRDWEVDLSVAAPMRGRGLASELIEQGVRQVRKRNDTRVHAFVKSANSASLGAFRKAGFQRSGVESVGGHEAVHLIYPSH